VKVSLIAAPKKNAAEDIYPETDETPNSDAQICPETLQTQLAMFSLGLSNVARLVERARLLDAANRIECPKELGSINHQNNPTFLAFSSDSSGWAATSRRGSEQDMVNSAPKAAGS